MWISELSRRSGVPVPTIKFYLRERLLPPGEATGATRAHYGEPHLRRLRLIRALVDVAAMRLDAVRAVLSAVDDESLSMHEVVGAAARRLPSGEGGPEPEPATLERIDLLLKRWGWRVPRDISHRLLLAQALDALAGLEQPVSDENLALYAEAMRSVAEREVSDVPVDGPERATEYVVTGTLLVEPVLLSLRRLAHADLSRRRLGRVRRRTR